METDLNRTKSLAADLPEHILADSILSSYSVNEYYIYTQTRSWRHGSLAGHISTPTFR
ncbi:hypothetical protein Pmar_PMAR013051 [Perkinsus marinus ATCC 50983]|uniref:Uncharacterized protein n=1 Tax=Perkinsus marinus (strain ATCC 50983 / TXsc) TaxID=423536 RepID=C5KUQ4_PERM5|nr:hypothetical protein Pmar_PMAR013051 [Perkinsus marinus ATCC 50983]EER11775.1 hypothetical protein Pmar_PMAR013051 [Perkinsus marinus ATCC 50983]|eukprot:XP_002779980.1 hypothetical protein Pmar_PMAR013051 [Perkinsus marinus ATCC 50983]